MSTDFFDWAARWGVPPQAVKELQERLGVLSQAMPAGTFTGHDEAGTQNRLRVAAAREGWHLWRNNTGACVDENGRHIRYGLCNDSQQLNRRVKSSDLVGIRPVLIGPQHVGTTIGQFVAREVKAPGWKYSGSDRERAQRVFIELVAAAGGDAKFTTGDL